ncbi:MAG: heme NO-binding domain-containing protein [Bacteroidota bacterium]
MKGVVFTEFLEMVEDNYGFEIADEIVTQADLPSGGIYSAVGTYPHTEMVALLTQLSKQIDTPVPTLLQTYGKHLFGAFTRGYAHFFERASSAFDFLGQIENHIHVEVLKLYPDAELPRFDIEQTDPKTLIMEYRSERGLADLAEGLIRSAIAYYQENITVGRQNIQPNFSHVIFTLTQQD